MSRSAQPVGSKTLADWLALPEDARIELIDGEFVEKAASTFEHGNAQGGTVGALRGPFHRKPGGPGKPGGWWIALEVDILRDGRVQIDGTLTVHRHTPDGYLVALRASEGERVRAEPFDAIELYVRVLLGGDED